MIIRRALRTAAALAATAALAGGRPAAAAQATGAAPWQGDRRLEVRVNVEAEGLAVTDLLARLSDVSGVGLSVRGEPGAEKVVVFERDRPLSAVLDDLAGLFDAQWEPRQPPGGGAVGYRLSLRPRAIRRDAALALDAASRLASVVDDYVRALSLSAEDLAERPEDDPVRQALSSPSGRMGLSLYALLSPAQREALWTRRRLAAPFSSLTPPQRQAVLAITRESIARLEEAARLHANNPAVRIAIPRLDDLPQGMVQFRVRQMGGFSVLLLQMPGGGLTLANADARSAWALPPHGSPYEPGPADTREPLPDARAVRAAAGAGASLADRLRHLADESGMPVLADLYRSRPLALPAGEATTPSDTAVAALDALCRDVGCLWWRRGEALLFRKRDWFMQRAQEAPDPVYESLGARAKRSGGALQGPDLLVLRGLTVEQIAGLASTENPLADASLLDGLPELIELLATLPANRGRTLLEGGGGSIAPRGLSARSTALLRNFAAAQNVLTALGPEEGLTVRAVCAPSGGAGTSTELHWSLGSRQGVYALTLPHGVPDDRRGRARIERAGE